MKSLLYIFCFSKVILILLSLQTPVYSANGFIKNACTRILISYRIRKKLKALGEDAHPSHIRLIEAERYLYKKIYDRFMLSFNDDVSKDPREFYKRSIVIDQFFKTRPPSSIRIKSRNFFQLRLSELPGNARIRTITHSENSIKLDYLDQDIVMAAKSGLDLRENIDGPWQKHFPFSLLVASYQPDKYDYPLIEINFIDDIGESLQRTTLKKSLEHLKELVSDNRPHKLIYFDIPDQRYYQLRIHSSHGRITIIKEKWSSGRLVHMGTKNIDQDVYLNYLFQNIGPGQEILFY